MKTRETRQEKRLRKHGPKAPVSFRRNFVPPIIGLFMMVGIMGMLNGQWLSAQFRYRFAAHVSAAAQAPTQPEAVAAIDTRSPNPERGPLLTVSSIGVEAPIVFEPSFEEWKVQVALRDGVVHYGSTVNPGENGNTVILGHSSGQPWAKGNYKFVFTLLEKVKAGEAITVDYNGTRYTYKVTDTFVVKPSDASVLQNTSKPTLTLITCTPVGTSTNRLVVRAEQISPAPQADHPDTERPEIPAVPKALPASAQQSVWDRITDLF
jgi:sortase A